MKTEKIPVTVKEFQGRSDWPGFTFPLVDETTADLFENVQELRNAGKFPNDGDILDMVNAKEKAKAKASKYQEMTSGVKKAYEDSADYKRKNLIAAAISAGYSQDEAEAFAAGKLG